MGKQAKASLRVRYQETDQMGVVHHANYIKWFEVGRTELLRELGTDYRTVEEQGLLLPVIEVTCQYKKPALYDDEILILSRVSKYTGVKLTFAYEVYRGDELLVTGTTTHCWTTPQFKPVNLKKAWPELHQLITSCVS
ncbi:4-hydroxybenzoyl-CoA thioesterase [Caldalkalibacillus thermarum TA2.A1]|uniref:4-hydroxybenzoyl-CoA thioesterase n=1 Tax=Caldalkalibacillus thermarum (strain TA2.A1) TaxID=986075 RepID=F5L941_CALTT|nr:thioesterase family protein [Caldalkalibacillus thermarum]EGL82115.1 4-hydroxybenzoyl-CoA thioesterase [Caldalkalibacillus thermarum TA2.A1]QZT34943.1 acyl-CoA thioesterase [Caldalkalibacillus thermarum TA2.A1]